LSIRTERIAEQLRQEISVILRDEVTDPRVGMCSITRIKLSRDLSHAQVFWSPLAVDDVDVDEMEEGLISAAPFVRRLVAQRLDLRRTPAIDFRYDPSIGEGDRMLALLKDVRDDDAAAGAAAAEDGGAIAGDEDDGSAT
jgi:ribosome-binding factor A